jgi:singapore isolate B (sub-type 7) whole genome shotgun sequence assembly, scaffold_2
LKPTHILNGFFLSLVEQYRKVMHFDKEIKEPLLNKYKHRDTSLRLSVHRLEMHRLEEARKKQQQAVNDDAVAMQTIDWGDFAVVETITFDEDNAVGLPKTVSIDASLGGEACGGGSGTER